MSIAHIVGIDPGLVHTGVVSLTFRPAAQRVDVEHTLITGPDATGAAAWIRGTAGPSSKVYIEQYRPRQRLQQDVLMVQLEQDLRRALPSATFLPNTGIKRVVPQAVMEALEVWAFKPTSHHQDLRSAARIALLGMMKVSYTNVILADAVKAHLDGQPWTIEHL